MDASDNIQLQPGERLTDDVSINTTTGHHPRGETVILVDDDNSRTPAKSGSENGTLQETNDRCSMRRSQRERQIPRSFSPTLKDKKRKTRIKRGKKEKVKKTEYRPCDKMPDGTPFSCDLCKSAYVCNPVSRKGPNRHKPSHHRPAPRQKVDPKSGRTLLLCNACGLAFEKPKKKKKPLIKYSPEDKSKYLEEAKTFALSLVEGLNDQDAEKLHCPNFKNNGLGCGCMQRYIIGDGEMEESRDRASGLLALLKEAKCLRSEKCYVLEIVDGKPKQPKSIGLGNGHKKSKNFEDFVLKNRKYMRGDLKLCEKAVQKVLLYSNNFLHKKLQTCEKLFRAERCKGKAALGKLKPIEDLPRETCCFDNCVILAVTHSCLLQQWRERAISSQKEARRVLAEMLTPSGGARSNCYKFISMVTGCSISTTSRVKEHMRATGGLREPTEHGMIKYWNEKKEKKSLEKNIETSVADAQVSPGTSTSPHYVVINSSPSSSLHMQREHLIQLQKQLTQQQMQIHEQQQILQQQLVQTTDQQVSSVITVQSVAPTIHNDSSPLSNNTPSTGTYCNNDSNITNTADTLEVSTSSQLGTTSSAVYPPESTQLGSRSLTVNQLQQILEVQQSMGMTHSMGSSGLTSPVLVHPGVDPSNVNMLGVLPPMSLEGMHDVGIAVDSYVLPQLAYQTPGNVLIVQQPHVVNLPIPVGHSVTGPDLLSVLLGHAPNNSTAPGHTIPCQEVVNATRALTTEETGTGDGPCQQGDMEEEDVLLGQPAQHVTIATDGTVDKEAVNISTDSVIQFLLASDAGNDD